MPFNREWDDGIAEYTINRDRTRPPTPPSTGTTVASTGAVIADSTEVTVRPSKVIKVTIPGPREKVINARGEMNQSWRRFFEELYRRTGYIEDNVNGLTDRTLAGNTAAAVAIAITGNAPTVLHTRLAAPSTGSIAITGETPIRIVA